MCGTDFLTSRQFLKEKTGSIQNEFGLVRKNVVWFQYYSHLLLT